MRHARLLLCLVLTISSSNALDWPMYLRDLSHSSSQSGETLIQPVNVQQLQQVWKTTVKGRISSAVTVWQGSLYFGDWSGNFYSLNARTGEIAWSTFIGVAPSPSDTSCMRGI